MRKAMLLAAVVLGIGVAAAGLARVASAEQDAGHQKGMTGMMGHRDMAGHHAMAFCPFATPGAQIKVTPTSSGVTIEVTASDPTAIARIQKKAQILQLMHELRALGPEHPSDAHDTNQPSHAEDAEEKL